MASTRKSRGSRKVGRSSRNSRRSGDAKRVVRIGSIEDDTALMPHVIADGVIGEVARFLRRDIPDREQIAARLDARANHIYRTNERFRKQMRSKSNSGRDHLYAFMRHWLAADLKRHFPGIYEKLPQTFANGEPLRGSAPAS